MADFRFSIVFQKLAETAQEQESPDAGADDSLMAREVDEIAELRRMTEQVSAEQTGLFTGT